MTGQGGLTDTEREALARALDYDDVANKPVRLSRGVWVTALDAIIPIVEEIVAARVQGRADLAANVNALADSIHGDTGWEHNSGCEGEPDCFACIVLDLRRIAAAADTTTRDDQALADGLKDWGK